MKNQEQPSEPLPPEIFTLSELETFRELEGHALADVNYYLWLNTAAGAESQFRFLYFLELLFEDAPALLLSSGEDSASIQVSSPEILLKTAETLRGLNGKISIQRVNAAPFPLWENTIGKPLEAIRLSKNEDGLYLNDALLLDFGFRQVLVCLAETEGLAVSVQN